MYNQETHRLSPDVNLASGANDIYSPWMAKALPILLRLWLSHPDILYLILTNLNLQGMVTPPVHFHYMWTEGLI